MIDVKRFKVDTSKKDIIFERLILRNCSLKYLFTENLHFNLLGGDIIDFLEKVELEVTMSVSEIVLRDYLNIVIFDDFLRDFQWKSYKNNAKKPLKKSELNGSNIVFNDIIQNKCKWFQFFLLMYNIEYIPLRDNSL